MSEDLNLGRLLGRREAFQIVAARCSAADAALMREIRDQKLYIGHAGDWGEFCVKHLHTSRENANRIIRMLDEFGPSYFAIAEITRISPATYRAIAPAVQDRKLLHNGETIDLIPENAERVASAVAEMRKATPNPRRPPIPFPRSTGAATTSSLSSIHSSKSGASRGAFPSWCRISNST